MFRSVKVLSNDLLDALLKNSYNNIKCILYFRLYRNDNNPNYSQAILQSKLESAIPKACRADRGYLDIIAINFRQTIK